jgi:hypothetical protein
MNSPKRLLTRYFRDDHTNEPRAARDGYRSPRQASGGCENPASRAGMFVLALALMLTACAPSVTVTRQSSPIAPEDKILVDIVFDTAGLAPVFRRELRGAGFSVADSKSEAVYVLSGSYVPRWDLVRYILVSGRFVITELETGRVMMRLETGPTHMASAETAVHKMVKDMVRENRKSWPQG